MARSWAPTVAWSRLGGRGRGRAVFWGMVAFLGTLVADPSRAVESFLPGMGWEGCCRGKLMETI